MYDLPPTGLKFTALEQAVLRAICEQHSVDRAPLEAQILTAAILKRENTGAGFYTHFTVERTSSAAVGGQRLRQGPAASINGLDHGMGFILWLKEGYLDCLEGYSYEESTTAIAFEEATFEILHD